ncbi:MAG: tetratricopeptide repeat protein [Paramuribaculum sp.]|nr:tetratricopeptide repeat protein [Paramuribaculum sp.]
MKRIMIGLLTATALLTTIGARAEQTSYDVLATKAERFYNQKDWSSASAMYGMMLAQRPNDTGIYCKAITAAGMRNNSSEQTALLNQALKAKTPIDSLFSGVEKASFAIGQTNLYENFLMTARIANPWMSRNIDSYLLKYYTFRRNGPKMIEYADIMLKGDPESETFGYALAQGMLNEGRTEEAMAEYRKILEKNPDAIEALLYLGNLEIATGNRSEALQLLKKAYALRPTPHVAARIRSLEGR